MKRLLVIYNKSSSQYVHVHSGVLAQLKDLKGYIVGKFVIEKTDFETNVSRLVKILKDNDLVISAGGDATAAVALNAIIRSKKDVALSVLPYGNFNDLSRTIKNRTLSQVIKSPDKIKKLYPLEIIVDGEHFRYASCYVTIGMTAEAVELFDDQEIRKNLQKGYKSSWRSYVYLAKWYFKNRHKKTFIPEFKLNGILQHRKTSDYAAVNGRSMCRVMKGGEDYLRPKVFRSKTDRLASFWRLFKLMARSILVRVPGTETTGDTLEFLEPSTVELQAEGEYKIFKDIKKIEIKKGEACLKVVQN